MEVIQVDFNDIKTKGNLPIVIYSSLSIKPDNEKIHLINIEQLGNGTEMQIEIFGNNFYRKGYIGAENSKLSIYTFRTEDLNDNYFIKIITSETTDDIKNSILFYGNYKYEKNNEYEKNNDKKS